MEEPLSLELLSEKALHQTADPRLIAYCPSMDLLALGCTDQQVLIYRLNGQRVYGASQKGSTLRVESISWKPNGQLLAIAWSDGSVRLVGAESSKTVHQFSTGGESSGVTCMGWTSNRICKHLGSAKPNKGPEPWEALLTDGNALSDSRPSLDLPRDLSLIDIETSLPKLSVLAGSSEDVFCSRSSLDALFRPFDPKDNDSVDVMVVGTREGSIHLSIYGSFVVGSFKSPATNGALTSHLVLHASHERYSTHALLMKSSDSEERLYFIPMDLRFISASNDYLSILASRSTALQNLLRYIQQVQILMVNEWKGTQELPARFLRNINETLGENENRDIVQALYHSVATGHTFPAVREWLVDELSERGHKRWDKAVVTGLENLKRLVHENMLPALERCSIILSRFSGIAKFQGSNDSVGFSSHQISLIMDTVACLHLVSSRILIQVVEELDLFASFSAWMRYEIDRLASDTSSSSPTEEMAEKEASIDHSKVLLYLQRIMTKSPLAVFFDGVSSETHNNDSAHAEEGVPMFALLHSQLQKQEQGLPYMRHLPQVHFLYQNLAQQANVVFGQIAEAEKRNVLFGKAIELGNIRSGALDMKISPIDGSSFYTHVAIVPIGRLNQIQIIQVTLSIESGISTVHNVKSLGLQLGDGQIKDIKFADNNTLLVLWESNGTTSLLSIPYRGDRDGNLAKYAMSYSPLTPTSHPKPTVFNDKEVVKRFSKYRIPSEESFVPEKMEIRERMGRARDNETGRIVIVGRDRLHYKVFKLPVQDMEGAADEDIPMS